MADGTSHLEVLGQSGVILEDVQTPEVLKDELEAPQERGDGCVRLVEEEKSQIF
jgi:hypothetical protein